MEHSKKMVLDAHKRGKTRRSSGLQEHRRRQHAVVFKRSQNRCEMCLWGKGDDMHHVYGRGKNKDDWREQADALLCVCRQCHPLPIQTPGYPSDPGGKRAEKALVKIYGEGIIAKHRRSCGTGKT